MQAEQAMPTAADRIVNAVARRWAVIVTVLLGIYAGLPWLSPLLRSWGFDRAGQIIFRIYSQFCHQLPERSFFVGQYQVCYCHRCVSLYTGLFAMSAVFSIGRWHRSLAGRWTLLLTLPMVIDGLWHMIDDVVPATLRSTDSSVGSLNFWLRMITGVLFAIGVTLWAYPRVQREIDRQW